MVVRSFTRWPLRSLAAVLLLVHGAAAHDTTSTDLPVSHLAGGGRTATDCLAGIEVTGVDVGPRARTVTCRDGDQICDRDRLVNGSCEFWLRLCFNEQDPACGLHGVAGVEVADGDGDRDLTILGRTLASVTMPSADPDLCAPLTTLTVPLRQRNNGTTTKARKAFALSASAMDGSADRDRVKFLCRPPEKERRKKGITFRTIQERIFETSCAFSGCHGVDSPQADLVLVGDGAYDILVDRPATTPGASFAGKKRVVPGAPSTSFLMDKITGQLGPGEGDPMPFGRSELAAADIDAIRKWILAGAPPTGRVGEGFAGDLDRQPRIPAPAVPTGGFQTKVDPFPLGDRPETEGCQFARLGNPDEIFVQKWELFMHEGSHHFIVRAFRCRDADGDGTNDCDEPDFDSRFPSGFHPCEEFNHLSSSFVVGSQTPHFIVDYQTPTTGVGLRLHKNQPLLLNSHYTNPFSDTMAEVWVNVTPADSALVTHPARILFEVVANAFIKVPPGTALPVSADTCAFAGSPLCEFSGEAPPAAEHFALLGLTSHMHKRSLKFVTDLHHPDGSRFSRGVDDMTDAEDGSQHLYVSTQYSDPINLAFWPPIIVEEGQQLEYTCLHDNGVETPVKLGCEEEAGVIPGNSILDQFATGGDLYHGAAKWCHSDVDCTGYGTGRCVPANLVFGELADDDMCILPGLYYPCSGDAASCLD